MSLRLVWYKPLSLVPSVWLVAGPEAAGYLRRWLERCILTLLLGPFPSLLPALSSFLPGPPFPPSSREPLSFPPSSWGPPSLPPPGSPLPSFLLGAPFPPSSWGPPSLLPPGPPTLPPPVVSRPLDCYSNLQPDSMAMFPLIFQSLQQ